MPAVVSAMPSMSPNSATGTLSTAVSKIGNSG